MIVQMLFSMSSGRHDNRVWPPPGVDFEVPDWEGEDLVNGGNAIKVADSPGPVPAQVQVQIQVPEPVPEPEPAPEPVEVADREPVPDMKLEPEPEVPGGPPRPAAPKAEWVEWALQQGADQIDANNATKQQLMELYGQRP